MGVLSNATQRLRRLAQRLTVGQLFTVAWGGVAIVAIAGIIAGELALHSLSENRSLTIGQIDPASRLALGLEGVLIDEESGVRGYVISGKTESLAPYLTGLDHERSDYAKLISLTRTGPLKAVRSDVVMVRERAEAWRKQYALPTIAQRPRLGAAAGTAVRADVGKSLFDAVRQALSHLNDALDRASRHAKARLSDSAELVSVVFGVFAGLTLLAAVLLAGFLRGLISNPLARLTGQVREVARGKFRTPIESSGPRNMAELAADVDSMRERILHELDALRQANERLDSQTKELERSNAELEQFAYVASHDLQEPLRKVASFTQLLQRRYEEQLDERAQEYISFAVDGAKRMQNLINDLLAFSRVGRIGEIQQVVSLSEALRQALTGLSTLIEETGARIDAGELPVVRGEPVLLSLVFQNLLGNSLKFHSDQRPVVSIQSRREGNDWLLTCSDNGIGIDPQYAERIFVIFQRLHTKEQYAGTGIGLAMCRKIIEYHGGRIWLDEQSTTGTTLHFTIPVMEDEI